MINLNIKGRVYYQDNWKSSKNVGGIHWKNLKNHFSENSRINWIKQRRLKYVEWNDQNFDWYK